MTATPTYFSDGATLNIIRTPLEQEHSIDNIEDVEEAVVFAIEAIEAADRLESMVSNSDGLDATTNKLLNVAVENYMSKFDIPHAALEDYPLVTQDNPSDTQSSKQTSTTKKVVLYLYAIAERIFKSIFDLFRTYYQTARKIMPKTKQYIGEADFLSASVASQLNIRDRSIMAALHIDGAAPRKIPELYDALAANFEKQHQYVVADELSKLVVAAKNKDETPIVEAANELRNKLEKGLAATLSEVSPAEVPVFAEKAVKANNYYASNAMFGQHYIVGVIAKEVNPSGTFRFNCSIKRDSEVPLRVNMFPVLTPEEIRHICRTSLKICENIIRFGRDEEILMKVLRQASFLKTKEVDKQSVIALKNISHVGQNSYSVHLRYTVRTMQALMRWCAMSIARYEEFKQNG